MNIYTKIQTVTGNIVLRKKLKLKKRYKQVYNLKTAKRLGIVFDATEKKNYEHVSGFVKDIRLKGIEVKVLGYVEKSDVPDEYLMKKNFSYFLKKSVNWYHKPVNPDVEKFLKDKFDILIDLSLCNDYLFKYIVALSPSRFKVGKFDENNDYYDLMIKLEKDKETKYFIEQVRHYLEVINRPDLTDNLVQV